MQVFSVFDSLLYGIRTVLDNFRLFFLLILTLVAVGVVCLGFIAIVNMTTIKEILDQLPQLKSMTTGCEGIDCGAIASAFYETLKNGWGLFTLSVGIVFIFMMGVYVGYLKLTLDLYDHGTASISTLFRNFGRLPYYLVAAALYLIIVGIGLALFIIPGVYLAVRLGFFRFFIVDTKSGIIDSLKHSWTITEDSAWDLVSLLFSTAFIMATIGGTLFAVPMVTLAYTYAYRKLAAYRFHQPHQVR